LNNQQKGGSGRIIPKYNGDMNDPNTTRETKVARAVHAKDKAMMDKKFEKMFPPPAPPQPVIDVKVMDSILGDKQAPAKPNTIYPMTQVPIPNPNNPMASDYLIPTHYDPQKIPIIKKYNISINGMGGNLSSISRVFEDILPETNIKMNRMTSLNERNVLHSYIRSILLKRGDGEEITFDDKKPELINLLSYMKMMEINPYHFSRLTDNAYKTMADNFLMMRSCYPIRLDKKSNNLSCATDNIGANIRIYALSMYDELAGVINEGGIRKVFSDVWRELMFYTYVREEILKKKSCPHFPFLHTYYLTENTSVDFDSLKSIKGSSTIKNSDFGKSNKKLTSKLFNSHMNNIITTEDGYNFTVNLNAFQNFKANKIIKYNKNAKRSAKMKDTDNLDINGNNVAVNERSSKCLVAITEAPDQNIIEWSTRTYIIEDGPIRRQVNSGVHSDLTWKSILFQMLVAFTTMYKHNIIIKELSWGKNFYIKTFNDTGPIGYWRYRVRGIDFYVPNMKALLMVDSCFDVVQDGYTGSFRDNMNFKIHGDFMETPTEMKLSSGLTISITDMNEDIKKKLFIDMFNQFFNPDEFRNVFSLYGGMKPSNDIILLLERISNYNFLDKNSSGNPDDLTDIYVKEFGFFLHNKLGDYVDQTDQQQLYDYGHGVNECKKGQMIAYTPDDDDRGVLIWAIVINSDNDTGTLNLLTYDKTSLQYKPQPNVAFNNCKTIFGDIQQKYKPDHMINSSDELLETYFVNI
jgi:hypothetical protein